MLGGGIGNIIGQLAQTQSTLSTLQFSRAQEYDADRLGIGYLSRAGYDPGASSTMLAALVGGAVAGVPGALVATPFVGAVKSLYLQLRWGVEPSPRARGLPAASVLRRLRRAR